MTDRTPSPKQRNRDSGRLNDLARQKLWNAIGEKLNPYGDKPPTADVIYDYVERSPKKERGVSLDLIRDFISPTPAADREFKKAKILFACFDLDIDKTNDWVAKQPSPNPLQSSIDWLAISHQLLTHQKNLTTNPLQLGATRNLDDVHVPLGLMERKERPKVKQEPSPEEGSQLYRETELTETKRFEHDEFLAEVVGKRKDNSKHIAIIGEPGAGKTTLLTKIGEWLLNPASQLEPAVVVWVSLAAVGSRRLEDYLKQEWLRQVWEGEDLTTPWESFKQMRQQGRVWLLLDGLDEMSGDAVRAIQRDLSEAWARNLRVVVTCRLNQWDGASNSLVNSFEVYRTLDYEYRTATGEDRVLEFLTKWFGNADTAQQIRTALDDAGKERIKDLVKNPLRLTLFCASWAENQALPETQAELYRRFVNYLYRWKAQEFQTEVNLRPQLDPALGKLAIAGLNRQPNPDGAVRRFRFTEPEIAKLWQDLPPTLLPAAKKLGWLNRVGEEAGENVYAFFHPTFQEYFAACSINNWDYFLPRAHVDRPVPCKGETEPTYRVFEKEWQQTILLWIGRGDVNDELKEEFIDKLTNFDLQEQQGEIGWLYYWSRSVLLAAIFVSEFKSSSQSQGIIQYLVKLAFGYFEAERQEWIPSARSAYQSLARETIPLAHRGYVITELVRLLEPNYWLESSSYVIENYNNFLVPIADALAKIGVGNQEAIAALLRILEREDLDDHHRLLVAYTLGAVDIRNPTAIETLVQFLSRNDLDDHFRVTVIYALGQIGVDIGGQNQEVIDTLIRLLSERHYLDNYDTLLWALVDKIGVENQAIIDTVVGLIAQVEDFNNVRNVILWKEILSEIGVGNEKAISTLLQSLEEVDLDLFNIGSALGKIGVGNEKVISTLLQFLEEVDLDDAIYSTIAFALGDIGVGNEGAISTLLQLLEREYLNVFRLSKLIYALGDIGVGDRRVIDALLQLLNQENLTDEVLFSAAAALLKSDRNPAAISALLQLLEQEDLSDNLLSHVAEVLVNIGLNAEAIPALLRLLDRGYSTMLTIHQLGQIAVGNQTAIVALLRLLEQKWEDRRQQNSDCSHVLKALGEIAVGDQTAIVALLRLLEQEKLEDWQYGFYFSRVSEALGKIATGNQGAIDALLRLFETEDMHFIFLVYVAEALEKILTESTMPLIVARLKPFTNVITSDMDDSTGYKFRNSDRVIFSCAQTLPYPTFHAAWHQTHLPKTIRPKTILLDITTFNAYTRTEIPQVLTNLIYSQLAIQPIPLVTTISQLQTYLLNFNYQPHLVIILHHPTAPTPTLIQEIVKLQFPKKIQILWLTNAPIPNAFPPEQPDLKAAIQSAIDRFTEWV